MGRVLEEIIVMEYIVVARETPDAGARACIGLMSLAEFDAEVSALDISWELTG